MNMMNQLDAVANGYLRMERAGEGKENSKKEKARQKKDKAVQRARKMETERTLKEEQRGRQFGGSSKS